MINDIEKVIISANRSDEEPFRLERLQRVVGYVCAKTEDSNSGIFSKIIEIRDHKGLLTVRWKDKPTKQEENVFKEAWLSHIGDLCDTVEHIV